jgi:hypothetical protein
MASANQVPDHDFVPESDFRDLPGLTRWVPIVVPVSAAAFAFLVYLIGWAVF